MEAFPDREALYAVNYRSGLWERLTWREIKEIVDRLAKGLDRSRVSEKVRNWPL